MLSEKQKIAGTDVTLSTSVYSMFSFNSSTDLLLIY